MIVYAYEKNMGILTFFLIIDYHFIENYCVRFDIYPPPNSYIFISHSIRLNVRIKDVLIIFGRNVYYVIYGPLKLEEKKRKLTLFL